MTPIQHPACNDVLRRPEGATEEECSDLHIARTSQTVTSFWQPEPAEQAAIAAGCPIILTFHSLTHPPVCVDVVAPTPEQAKAAGDAESKAHRKFHAVLKVAKDLAAHAAKHLPAHKDTKRFTDALLDSIK